MFTERQQFLIISCLGLSAGNVWGNRFTVRVGSDDDKEWDDLIERGFAEVREEPKTVEAGTFRSLRVTEACAKALKITKAALEAGEALQERLCDQSWESKLRSAKRASKA